MPTYLDRATEAEYLTPYSTHEYDDALQGFQGMRIMVRY